MPTRSAARWRACAPSLALGVALALAWVAPARALAPGDRVDDFRLVDHQGVSHQLYYLSDMRAVVLASYGNACAEMPAAVAALTSLRAKLADPAVAFLMIDANLGDTRAAVAAQAAKLASDVPILLDETQLIGESLGLAANGEALVIDPKTWTLAYRGGLTGADASGLVAAVDALRQGKTVPARAGQGAPGACAIDFPEHARRDAHAAISYERTIAPLLIEKCVACHRPGGIGPFAMTGYPIVFGFAPMIREVLRTERMPPWHADSHFLPFANDRSLTLDQTRQLVHWIEAGAARGEGADPLAAYHKDWPDWPLGQPDLVVEIPPFEVPATGVLPYRNVMVPFALDRDVWVRAVDFRPGDRRVVHHVVTWVARGGLTHLSNWVPGTEPLELPAETGILVRAGSRFRFQLHYTPNGVQTLDATRMGLYFRDAPPRFRYRSVVLQNRNLRIPPNVKSHTETASTTFARDALVYSLHPHAHFRGRSARFVATYPDGREQVLLDVPRYDFNWQATYQLAQPLRLPAGTRVTYTGVFDNSAQNKANPDPSREVPWGQQSWDEMLYGLIRYRGLVPDADGDGDRQ